MPKKPLQIKQLETLGHGHWYSINGKPVPSVTTILTAYPQSLQLTQWIAQKGWEESQRIKTEAGTRGTVVHQAIEALLKGDELFRVHYSNDEFNRLVSFVKWFKEYNPTILDTEILLGSKKYKYAGKADAVMHLNTGTVIIDWKTSQAIHAHFPLQVAAYAQAYEEMNKPQTIEATAILQLGAKNKNGYRFVIYPDWRDHFKAFLNVKATWLFENAKEDGTLEPPVLELPESLKL